MNIFNSLPLARQPLKSEPLRFLGFVVELGRSLLFLTDLLRMSSSDSNCISKSKLCNLPLFIAGQQPYFGISAKKKDVLLCFSYMERTTVDVLRIAGAGICQGHTTTIHYICIICPGPLRAVGSNPLVGSGVARLVSAVSCWSSSVLCHRCGDFTGQFVAMAGALPAVL